jgi:hypothetical protein
MSGPGGIGYGSARQEANGLAWASPATPNAHHPLGRRVVRLHLVVVDGPVDERRPVDRSGRGHRLEVVLTEAGQLAVGVEAAAPHGGGQVVDVADVEPLAVVLGAAERPRLQPRVGSEEVPAHELQLVVRDVAERSEGSFEREEMVAALLQQQHRPAGTGQHLGRSRARGPGADDDRVPFP